MASQAVDPYYYSSRMRELSGQKELTTGRGLTQPELEAILNAELSARYTAEQGRRQQKMQERALDIQEQSAEDQAEAAKLSGYAQLGMLGVYGASKAPAAISYGKKAIDWASGATPAVTTSTGVTGTTAAGETIGYSAVPGMESQAAMDAGLNYTPATSGVTSSTTPAGTAGAGAGSTAFNVAAPIALAYGIEQSGARDIIAKGWNEFTNEFLPDPVGYLDQRWNLEEFEQSSGIPGFDKDMNSVKDIWSKWF